MEEQAASVLATVKRDGMEARGEKWTAEEEEQFKILFVSNMRRRGILTTPQPDFWDDG